MRFPRLALAGPCAALLLAGALPGPVGASTEEFSTFSVEAQEEDDESLIDHLLTRPPREWRDEWERSALAVRSAQGCLTSGQWFLENDVKLSTSLGKRARFGLDLRESVSDVSDYETLDFSFRFPTRWGTPGVIFRPLYDKARQDFALLYETGPDTSAAWVQAVFTLEDLFNNFWAFRQTRVGTRSESYERHPWEPALRASLRGHGWRVALDGKYLTPSRKRLLPLSELDPERTGTLWGTHAAARVELQVAGFRVEAAGDNRQATSTEQPLALPAPDARDFRRQWHAEVAARRAVAPAVTAEVRGVYAARTGTRGAPLAGTLEVRDRVLQAETVWRLRPTLGLRLGGLYDRIQVWRSGAIAVSGYGTRNESRAYVGLVARFGRVSVSAVEGVELDPEPYDVWGVHDKGFLHLQTSF